MPAPVPVAPVAGSVYFFDGRNVRLERPHGRDVRVWIAVGVDNPDFRTFVGVPWMNSNAPVSVGTGGSQPVAAIASPQTAPALAPVVARPAPAPAPVMPEQPLCPLCSRRYTGRMGHQHNCAGVLERRCMHCNNVNPASLTQAHPPAYPYLCPTCVTANTRVCRTCTKTFQGAVLSGTALICNDCTPLNAGNIWATLPNASARGNDIYAETRSYRQFAVEIESYRMPAESHESDGAPGVGWQRASDGSIRPEPGAGNAVEFRSPPFRGDGGLNMLYKDVKKIRNMGYRANKSCGLHVHVNALDFKEDEFKALHQFGRWIQDDMYKMVAPSRSGNQFCQKLEARMQGEDGERYRWLNIKPSWERHRTVEFRLHHGVTNPERVYEWTKVCLQVVERALRFGVLPSKPALSTLQLLDMSKFQQDYWMSVAKSLRPGMAVSFDGRSL